MSDVSTLFDDVLSAIAALNEVGSVNPSTLDEAVARLRSLRRQYEECMRLHDGVQRLIATEFALPQYDPQREALVQYVDGKIVELFKLNRADPDTPIKELGVSAFSSFVPGAASRKGKISKELEELELQLSSNVEGFYTAASHWWQLFELQVVGRSKPKFIGVQMVRNKLIEHADKTFTSSNSDIINSFGTSSESGPTVKPHRFKDQSNEHQDAGLIPNIFEMLSIAQDHLSDQQA